MSRTPERCVVRQRVTRRRAAGRRVAGRPLPGRRAWIVLLLAALLPGACVPALADEIQSERLKRIGLSLLLPGSAQLRAGQKGRGLAFLVADAACWTGFGAYRLQGADRRETSIEMARIHAGVQDAEGRTEDYYRLLAAWPSSDIYDELVRYDAQALYEDDLAAREAYFQANRMPAEKRWRWESDAARQRFADKRGDSKRSYRTARNLAGLAVANRLVAMLDAIAFSPSATGADAATTLEFRPVFRGEHLGARVALRRRLW